MSDHLLLTGILALFDLGIVFVACNTISNSFWISRLVGMGLCTAVNIAIFWFLERDSKNRNYNHKQYSELGLWLKQVDNAFDILKLGVTFINIYLSLTMNTTYCLGSSKFPLYLLGLAGLILVCLLEITFMKRSLSLVITGSQTMNNKRNGWVKYLYGLPSLGVLIGYVFSRSEKNNAIYFIFGCLVLMGAILFFDAFIPTLWTIILYPQKKNGFSSAREMVVQSEVES